MTNEKRYEYLLTVAQALDNALDMQVLTTLKADPQGVAENRYLPAGYAELGRMMLECREGMQKTKGGALSALKRVLKGGSHPDMNKLLPYGDKFIAIDGYRLFRLNEDVPSLPHGDKCPFDIDKLMPDVYGMHEAPLPDVADLKAKVAERKAAKAKIPFIYLDYIGFDPQYVLDTIAILDDPVMFLPEKPNMPIYFKGSNGDAIVLPVNVSDITGGRTYSEAVA